MKTTISKNFKLCYWQLNTGNKTAITKIIRAQTEIGHVPLKNTRKNENLEEQIIFLEEFLLTFAVETNTTYATD